MKNLLMTLITLMSVVAFAQKKGTISGKIQDKSAGLEPLAFVSVFDSKDHSVGTTSDFDGNYTIKLKPGIHTLVFDFVGYKTIKKQVTVKAGATQNVNVVMASVADNLDAVVLKAVTNKESESALIDAQKETVQIVTSIGAAELSKKGVGDVATAVTKTSGITKEEGGEGSIFVRGLGDRYNTTTLNGLPLPSNNVLTKNINLGLFSTGIVEYIGISKTFESQNNADFGGANININSKKFSGNPYVKFGLGTGVNSNVLGQKNFYLQDGPSYFGFKTIKAPVEPSQPSNFSTSWDRQLRNNHKFNGNFSLSGGRRFKIKNAGKISVFLTGSYNAKNTFKEGIARYNVSGTGQVNTDLYRKSYGFNTNTTLMGTADYKINQQNSILFTSFFLNSTLQDYSEYKGTKNEYPSGASIHGADGFAFIKRGTFTKTRLIVNQLVGKHELNEQFGINWATGYNIVNNVIPDRMQNSFMHPGTDASVYSFRRNNANDNHRYFQNLDGGEFSGKVSSYFKFNKNGEDDDYKGKLTLGYSKRYKTADFKSNLYGFQPKRGEVTFSEKGINQVDKYLNPILFGESSNIFTNINRYYNATIDVNSLFANIEYKITPKLTAILGARLESVQQNIFYKISLRPNGKNIPYSLSKLLPSLTSKYKLNDKQNLKFSFSKTYTLPQVKEKAALFYRNVTQTYQGNPNLYASTNYNVDLGWELYPEDGGLISFSLFGKIIKNPINEVQIAPGTTIGYANTGKQAKVAGVELELKKNLFLIENEDNLQTKLSVGFNGSYLYNHQDLDAAKVARENVLDDGVGVVFSYKSSALTGASKYLANADISYFKEFKKGKDIMATVSYAYFSDKLAVIGTGGRGNTIDKAISKLNFIVKASLTKKIKLGISAKNLLNPAYRRIQQMKDPKYSNVLIRSYKLGYTGSISLNYTF